jgi:hypothetical protein
MLRKTGIYWSPDAVGAGAAAGGGGGTWTAPQGEEWRTELPESLRDKPLPEIVKWGRSAHDQMGSLNNDLGKYKQDLTKHQQDLQHWQQAANQYQTGVNEWAKWYGEHVKPHWSAFEAWRNGQGAQPAAAAAQPAEQDVFKNWGTMEPQAQAQAMAQYLAQQSQQSYQGFEKKFGETWDGYQKKLQDYVGERERYLTTYLRLWQQAWEAKQKDPNLDIDKAVQQAIQVMSGQVDPFALGVQLSTADRSREAYLAEAKKQWEAEAATKLQNQQIAPPASAGTPPVYKARPATPGGTASLRERAAEALAKKYGASIF